MSAASREEHSIRKFLRSSFEDLTDPKVMYQRKMQRNLMPVLIICMILVSGNTILGLGIPLMLALVFFEEYLRIRTGWPFLDCWGARIVVTAFTCIPLGLVLASFGALYLVILVGIVVGLIVYCRHCYHKWKLESEKRTCIEINAEREPRSPS